MSSHVFIGEEFNPHLRGGKQLSWLKRSDFSTVLQRRNRLPLQMERCQKAGYQEIKGAAILQLSLNYMLQLMCVIKSCQHPDQPSTATVAQPMLKAEVLHQGQSPRFVLLNLCANVYKLPACDGHNGSGVNAQRSSLHTRAQRSLSTGHLRLYLAVEGNLKWF
ncbi:hypothetical protein QQF64_031953 [Cirrhinus molitorella]|uniref:Uncharacterized protein n=1 Tax=Cirrhinus molitorella TaxID=172907 RepID=A0ABR3MYE6_9TELE